jgi:hypothetical protein
VQPNEDPRGAAAPLFAGYEAVVRGIVLALAAVGVVCIVGGAALALYAGWVVVRLIEDPASVPSLSYFAGIGAAGLQAMRGLVEGRTFELELGRPLYGMGMLFIGVLVLAAIASLAKALISAGLNLVRPALGRPLDRTG